MENKEKARQHEINLKRLDQNLPAVIDPLHNDGFRFSAAIEFVPPFDEVDMTQFLDAFEKVMNIHAFPRDKWTQLIHTKLTGKAQKVFAELSVDALRYALGRIAACKRACSGIPSEKVSGFE